MWTLLFIISIQYSVLFSKLLTRYASQSTSAIWIQSDGQLTFRFWRQLFEAAYKVGWVNDRAEGYTDLWSWIVCPKHICRGFVQKKGT